MEYLKKSEPIGEQVTQNIRESVSEILMAVAREGITAVRRYSKQLDDWNPESFVISEREIRRAPHSVDEELKGYINFAQAQVRNFAHLQRETLVDFERETLPGVVLGQKQIPVNAAGCYAPGGRYPVLASTIMGIVTAKVAGVKHVVAVAPPRRGENGIYPPMLYTMASSGADQILHMGGVQALAAIAYGMEGVEPVDIVIGAGNAYVAEAKRQLFGLVGIDLLAGPTEILVIADESARPSVVAVDLLGQAEHGPTSPAVLVTTSQKLGELVLAEVEDVLKDWPTADVAGEAWRDFGTVVVAEHAEEAIALSDRFAPEHLELQVEDAAPYEAGLRNYGSLFVGEETTVPFGDKVVGTNHTLPTSGAARYTGGVWGGKVFKKPTHQRP